MTPRAVVLRRFLVIGGGDDGAAYVRQLLRAVSAGRLVAERIHVVDRDPSCAASRCDAALVQLEAADWSDWLDARLDDFGEGDQLVPYHWAPHLLLEWLERQLARRGARTSRSAVPAAGLPFERQTAANGRALSYATWACPALCIEPALCPHTRGPRDWSLATHLAGPDATGDAFDERVVFRSFHLVWGVAAIPVADLLAARDRLVAGLSWGPRSYLVATSSHCHGLAAGLEVAPACHGAGIPVRPTLESS